MAVFFAKVLYYAVFEDTEKSPGHLDQWFRSCGTYAIMVDKLFQSDIKKKKKPSHVFSLPKMVCAVHAMITTQGGKRFPVPEHGSAQNWSDSYHTWSLPYAAVGASATIALVEPGALSMVMASKQAQLRNLCSNLSAAYGWLYFGLTKWTPSWRVWWEDLHK